MSSNAKHSRTTKTTAASVSKSRVPPKSKISKIVKEVSPLTKQATIVRPPKADTTPDVSSQVTVMPVKAHLDRRVSRSAESLESTSASDDERKSPFLGTSLVSETKNASQDVSEIPGENGTVPSDQGNIAPIPVVPNKPFSAFPTQKSMAEALAGASGSRSSAYRQPTTKPHAARVSTPTMFPTKDHAFLLQSVDSVSIHQYLRAVADLVGPKNIWFGSRLSLGRVAIYLTSVELLNSFMAVHGGIEIGDEFLPARRMVTKASRLILSNVCPTIPHIVLEDILSTAVKLVSPMSFVNVGGKDPELSSIFSFRRQIFVNSLTHVNSLNRSWLISMVIVTECFYPSMI
jgi:hypothetical protein